MGLNFVVLFRIPVASGHKYRAPIYTKVISQSLVLPSIHLGHIIPSTNFRTFLILPLVIFRFSFVLYIFFYLILFLLSLFSLYTHKFVNNLTCTSRFRADETVIYLNQCQPYNFLGIFILKHVEKRIRKLCT